MAGPTYKDAGVDIDAADQLVSAIGPLVAATHRPEVVGGIGGFAGLCALPSGYREPLLVSGTDGVGTKLDIAIAAGRHRTIGIDLVAMAVNDVITCGAEPLFFLDYLAVGKLQPEVAIEVIAGIADGCRQAGCALLGGETAEMPGFYPPGRYDLAGFCVGVVERSDVRDGRDIEVGDLVIGLPSAGVHANGLSLARKVLLERYRLDDTPGGLGGASLADELLRPTVIYASALARLRERDIPFKAASHITGGGLIDNPPRMFGGRTLGVQFDTSTWTVPAVFGLIAEAGVADDEMRRTFNMGLGMLLVLAPAVAEAALGALADDGARVVGQITEHPGSRF